MRQAAPGEEGTLPRAAGAARTGAFPRPARFLLRARSGGDMERTLLRIVIPLGLVAFAALMAYAMTLQLRIWHVMPW